MKLKRVYMFYISFPDTTWCFCFLDQYHHKTLCILGSKMPSFLSVCICFHFIPHDLRMVWATQSSFLDPCLFIVFDGLGLSISNKYTNCVQALFIHFVNVVEDYLFKISLPLIQNSSSKFDTFHFNCSF